ncbi:MAG: dethiobiotin synthase, partial [Bacteroidia bacterium]
MSKLIFVTGIGTGIGKTIVSAILTEALKADYWKPIQTGNIGDSDSETVGNLISNTDSVIHKEAYSLKKPASPHAAATDENITIVEENIILPESQNKILIIEGAGGLMVPLNDSFLMIDLIQKLKAEVVLVSANYLGSINHTLLSAEALKQRNIPVKGIVFNGEVYHEGEDFILNYTAL